MQMEIYFKIYVCISGYVIFPFQNENYTLVFIFSKIFASYYFECEKFNVYISNIILHNFIGVGYRRKLRKRDLFWNSYILLFFRTFCLQVF